MEKLKQDYFLDNLQNNAEKHGLDLHFLQNIINENILQKHKAEEKMLLWFEDEIKSFISPDAMVPPVFASVLITFKNTNATTDEQSDVDNSLLAKNRYYKDLLQLLIDVRKSCLSSEFIKALTQEGVGGMPKPIEIHAYDPLRYVGDMLAWVQQSLISESEFLSAILSSTHETFESRRFHSIPNEEKAFSTAPSYDGVGDLFNDKDATAIVLLNNIVDGIGRSLKIRIEQIIISETNEVTLFKLLNLLKYYENHTIKHFLDGPYSDKEDLLRCKMPNFISTFSGGGGRDFRAVFSHCLELARDKLASSLEHSSRRYANFHKNYSRGEPKSITNDGTSRFESSDQEMPSNDLYPTPSLMYALTLAKDMFEAFRVSFDVSVSESDLVSQKENEDFIKIMEHLKLPIVRIVTHSSQLLLHSGKGADSKDSSAFSKYDAAITSYDNITPSMASPPNVKVNVYQLNCFYVIKRELLGSNSTKEYNLNNATDVPGTENSSFNSKQDDDMIFQFVRSIEKQLKISQNLGYLSKAQGDYVYCKTGFNVIAQTLVERLSPSSTFTEIFTFDTSNTCQDSDGTERKFLTETRNNMMHFINASFLIFDQFLAAPDLFILPEIPLLQDITWRDWILAESYKHIISEYEKIYKKLMDKSVYDGHRNPEESSTSLNGPNHFHEELLNFLAANGVVVKTPEQISELLK